MMPRHCGTNYSTMVDINWPLESCRDQVPWMTQRPMFGNSKTHFMCIFKVVECSPDFYALFLWRVQTCYGQIEINLTWNNPFHCYCLSKIRSLDCAVAASLRPKDQLDKELSLEHYTNICVHYNTWIVWWIWIIHQYIFRVYRGVLKLVNHTNGEMMTPLMAKTILCQKILCEIEIFSDKLLLKTDFSGIVRTDTDDSPISLI